MIICIYYFLRNGVTVVAKPFPINHDLHTHTFISECCGDEKLTAAYTIGFAKQNGYDAVCVTDHFWDAGAPGASEWYSPQDLRHVKQSLPLPRADGVRVMFGCETEFCGGTKIGITPACYAEFDMIVVPVNHFHMEGFVRPAECNTVEAVSELLIRRLEELLKLDLPWEKVGIAHLNDCIYMHGDEYDNALMMIPEARLRSVFGGLARKGAGIELNASAFRPGWDQNGKGGYRLLKTALEENCKFYCASDSHECVNLEMIAARMRGAADTLGLTAGDLFMPLN